MTIKTGGDDEKLAEQAVSTLKPILQLDIRYSNFKF